MEQTDAPSGMDGEAASTVGSQQTTSTAASASTNPYKCVHNGIPMTWNETAKQWIPDVEVDEEFLARYNLSYGLSYDSAQASEGSKSAQQTPCTNPQTDPNARGKKRTKDEKAAASSSQLTPQQEQPGWVEIEEEKNTNVYVSGLPPDTITDEKFVEFMSKCGVIMRDPRTNKPKVKLYRTETGEPKGDGTCCYIKMESVHLALQILDGWNWDGHTVHVERAKFQMKGDYDPNRKKKKLTAAQKKRFFENQQKIFEWKPEKPRNYRPPCECTLVLKNLFTLEELAENPARILDLKDEVKELCERFGTTKKLPVIYDTSTDGVVTVQFESVEQTDAAVRALNGRLVAGREISASLWDGKEKFKKEETEEDRKQRDESWEKYLEQSEADGGAGDG